MDSEIIVKLRAKAERCRELADKATDPEAAESLLQLAGEIEAALPMFENNEARLKASP
jgi:hypothetical protein